MEKSVQEHLVDYTRLDKPRKLYLLVSTYSHPLSITVHVRLCKYCGLII
jgi:hypothetical protein